MPVVKWLVIKLLRGPNPPWVDPRVHRTQALLIFRSIAVNSHFLGKNSHHHPLDFHHPSTNLTKCAHKPKFRYPSVSAWNIPRVTVVPFTQGNCQKKVQLGIERFGELLCQFVFYIKSVSRQWIWSIFHQKPWWCISFHIISAQTSCLFLPRKMPPKWPSALVSRH